MNRLLPLLLIAAAANSAFADGGDTNLPARLVLQRVVANRPAKDFSLKARLFVTREQIVPLDIQIKNTPTETRTIYRGGKVELLTVQPVNGVARLYLRGVGELTGARRMETLFGSQFTYYDLGLPFLHWSNPKSLGEDRVRGRDCYTLSCQATNEPYAQVKMWIDKEYFGLVRAEVSDANETLLKRFAVTSLKRIDDVWIPRALVAAARLPGQVLPSEETSRLEIIEGNYDAKLPLDKFSPALFGGRETAP